MISSHGVSKHTVEYYLKVYKELYGINYNILICSNVYGPRQDSSGEGGVVSIFFDKILKGQVPTIFEDGEQIRDFVYVKDVAMANSMMLKIDKCGIYNLCTNTKTTINQLFNCIKEIANIGICPYYEEQRAEDIITSYMSYDKIKKEVGWEPTYELKDGLNEIIKNVSKDKLIIKEADFQKGNYALNEI
mgnify:CR=1 FL=1